MQLSKLTFAFALAMCLCLFAPMVSAFPKDDNLKTITATGPPCEVRHCPPPYPTHLQTTRQHQPPHGSKQNSHLSGRQNFIHHPTSGLHSAICVEHDLTAPRGRVSHAQWILHTLGAGESPQYAGGPYEVWDKRASWAGAGQCADAYCYQGVKVYWCNDVRDNLWYLFVVR
ncbi:uncharacterized protein BDV14DRAFT_204199 [Aspergillus stella-maris]|uniref:uncharacterized protein n=1 Tax=Aspergillus stella-maris TaxID=1810926 RepID=UPI003CCE4D2D